MNGKEIPAGAKNCGYLLGLIFWVAYGILLVYLGIYAYKNPDPKACWVVRDLHTTATTKQEVIARANAMGIVVTEGYP